MLLHDATVCDNVTMTVIKSSTDETFETPTFIFTNKLISDLMFV